MGVPKYKNYPINGDKKALKNAKEQDRLENDKVLKLQEEIKNLLLNPEKKELAASIISSWIKKESNKP